MLFKSGRKGFKNGIMQLGTTHGKMCQHNATNNSITDLINLTSNSELCNASSY